MAALLSGQQINVQKLSQEVGVSRHVIEEYLIILEDCLITERIEPITINAPKRRLTKSPKYLFFDMGIRRIAAREGESMSITHLGNVFEQFIGLEILRLLRAKSSMIKLCYWRDHAGPEIDYVLDANKKFTPIEVKWTAQPTTSDIKHLRIFMNEYPCEKLAYVICRCERPFMIEENVMALPWQQLALVLS